MEELSIERAVVNSDTQNHCQANSLTIPAHVDPISSLPNSPCPKEIR